VEVPFPESVTFPASPVEAGFDPDDVEVVVVVVEDEEDVDEEVELPVPVGSLPEPVVVVEVVFPELETPVGSDVGVLLVVVFVVEVLLLTPVGADEVVDVEVDVVFVLRFVELEDEELEVTRNSSTELQPGRKPVVSSRISLSSLEQMKAFKLSPSIEAKISPPAPTVQSMEEL
jgi:hypothetical protein